MATASDTFQRKEKKYLISTGQCAVIKEGLTPYMRLDDYGVTRIDSLYLDSSDHNLICKSLEKPLYKEKLRIRSYGAFSEAEAVFVEIKKKYKGIVYKRRVRMSSKGARAYYTHQMTYEQAQHVYPVLQNPENDLTVGKIQIAREIDAFFKRHPGIEPAMLISCMREAWCPIERVDEECVDRVTFDESISYVDLLEPNGVQRRPVISEDLVVMEIKCAGGYPQWLCDLLGDCGAYPRSFSKYGNAFKRVLSERGDVSIAPAATSKLVIQGAHIDTSGAFKERSLAFAS